MDGSEHDLDDADRNDTPYGRLGGRAAVLALAETFYDVMEVKEPALARLHVCDEQGRIDRGSRERFGLFLIGWLGGPQEYIEKHGHPRLRMRHAQVPVDEAMRDAWLRCMSAAMDQHRIVGLERQMMDQRFAQVADFLRNR